MKRILISLLVVYSFFAGVLKVSAETLSFPMSYTDGPSLPQPPVDYTYYGTTYTFDNLIVSYGATTSPFTIQYFTTQEYSPKMICQNEPCAGGPADAYHQRWLYVYCWDNVCDYPGIFFDVPRAVWVDDIIYSTVPIYKSDGVTIYREADSVPPLPAVTAPLHDEEGLIMTTSDYSNFATREYFNVLRINHSGVDLALSPTGIRTASQITAGKSVYPICDGTVEYIHNGGGLYSFAKIRHPNCNGQEVVAYYGHIAVIDGLTDVTTEEPIGTVKDWRGNSHLHLTIDTQTERNLSRINNIVCDYTLDANQTVTSLSNCSNATGKLAKNKMLLRMGWGQVRTQSYKDSSSHTYRKNLFISEDAMRQLGFISFFDLY